MHNRKDILASLARAWATLLPCRLTCEIGWVWNKPAIDLKSFTKCPIRVFELSSSLILLTIPSASPSKHTSLKPGSFVKIAALLVANISRISTDDGIKIFSKSAALTTPLSLRTTTLTPASFKSPNTAPSKFTLTELGGGGVQWVGLEKRWPVWLGFFCWNSVSRDKADL